MQHLIDRRAAILGSIALLGTPGAALAQPYSNRPVRIVVPYPAASSPDALARLLAEGLGKSIGQTVVVENKPGAGGMIGAKLVSESAPDGNTLLMYTPAWSAAKIFLKKPMVAVPEGLEPVTMVAEGRFALTVSGALPVQSFQDLILLAKAKPGTLNFATTGLGDSLLYFHTLRLEKGVQIETIQYKGSSEYITGLVSNQVQLAFTPEYNVLPFVKEGKLKVLAVTGDTRSLAYPEVPTFKELGLPKIRNNWMSIFAPRGTPPELVQRIRADLSALIQSPQTSKRIHDIYFEPIGSTPEQLRKRIQLEIDEWSTLARTVGLQAE